jgi:hypothetical protein
MTMQRTIKLYRLPEAPKTPGFRKLTEPDCQQAFTLLAEVKEMAPELFSFYFKIRL